MTSMKRTGLKPAVTAGGLALTLVLGGLAAVHAASRGRQAEPAAARPAVTQVLMTVMSEGRPGLLRAADVDGDGRHDLVLADTQRREIEIRRGTGDGAVEEARSVRLSLRETPVALVTGEYDERAGSVLSVLTGAPDRVRILAGGPGGELRDLGYLELPGPGSSLAQGDFDADGKLDLAVALPGSREVALFLGRGGGLFVAGDAVPVEGRPTWLAAGALDGEPGDDLAVLDGEVSETRILRNDGRGRFEAARPVRGMSSRPAGLQVAELDGDGLADLVVVHEGGGLVALRGDGRGRFAAAGAAELGVPVGALAVGRFQADGPDRIMIQLEGIPTILVVHLDVERRLLLAGDSGQASRDGFGLLAALPTYRDGRRLPDTLAIVEGAARAHRSPLAERPGSHRPGERPVPAQPPGGSILTASITITAPLANVTVKEGDDFFSTVMGNPIDFDDRRDFGWEEQFNDGTIKVSDGEWKGTFQATGAYVFPLFPGFNTGWTIGRTGARYPIDPNKYTYLAWRSKVSSRSTKAVYVSNVVDWPTNLVKAELDGYFTNSQGVKHPSDRYVVDLHDLRGNGTWKAGAIRGLRLDPSTGGPPGTEVEYEWVRLVDPTSGPTLTIQWTTANVPRPDQSIIPQVHVYADSDQSGLDGAWLGRANYDSGAFAFPSAALPQGKYYFHLRLTNNTDGDTTLANSGYSAAVIVNGKTRVQFTHPDWTSGPDYATTVVKNPWDMNDPADLMNLNGPIFERGWESPVFAGGAFTATAIVQPGHTESDAQVWLNVDPNKPIESKKYRYLTFEMSIDPTGYTNISNKVEKGWINRAMWWTQRIDLDGSDTFGAVAYEGVRSYNADLTEDGILDVKDPFPEQKPWTFHPTHSHFRLDLTEAVFPTKFSLYDVKLTAAPEPAGDNTFTARFKTTDPEGDSVSAKLFLDTDRSGFDGTQVASACGAPCLAPGTHTLAFNAAAVSPGTRYLYLELTDAAGNVTRRYADIPISVKIPVWHDFFAVDTRETPYVGDWNGDGKTDIITFTRDNPLAFGDVYASLSTGSGFGPNLKWHDFFAISLSEVVVIGDYDGDGKDDIGTWLKDSTRQVYVARSLGASMGEASVWLSSIGGDPGDILLAGDANGDGKDDLILFQRKVGKVQVALSTGSGFGAPAKWHDFFAVSTFERPRVGDVDGDGKTDILTFATDSPTAFGDVYVARSTGSSFGGNEKWHDFFSISQDQLIRIGDINGDKKDDFFTFLPAPFGQVYVVQSLGHAMGPNNLYIPEGMAPGAGNQFYVGDANGDGKVDIIWFAQTEGKVRVALSP